MFSAFLKFLGSFASLEHDRIALGVFAILSAGLAISAWFSSGLDAAGTAVAMIIALSVFTIVVRGRRS